MSDHGLSYIYGVCLSDYQRASDHDEILKAYRKSRMQILTGFLGIISVSIGVGWFLLQLLPGELIYADSAPRGGGIDPFSLLILVPLFLIVYGYLILVVQNWAYLSAIKALENNDITNAVTPSPFPSAWRILRNPKWPGDKKL